MRTEASIDLKTMRALWSCHVPTEGSSMCIHKTVCRISDVLWCEDCGAISMADGSTPMIVNRYPDFPAGYAVRTKKVGTIDADGVEVAPENRRLR